MPEVTVRSSVGDQVGATPFDLSTQQGVAELLHQVRSSSLPGATKTAIRELVLRFARDGGDGVREELESILKNVSLLAGVATPQTESTTAAPTADIELPLESVKESKGGRRVPVFGVSPQPASEPAPQPVTTPTPIPEPTPAPEPVVPAAPPPTPEPTQAPAPAVPAPPAAAVPADQDHLARVQEIKREVIALVGNPVNLVAADNAVGKQYMSALLEAMKKINGGTRIEVSAAMQELENAFVAVRGLAERGMTATPASSSTQTSAPEPAPELTSIPAVPVPPPAPPTPEPVVPAPAPTPPSPPPIPDELKAVAGVKENLVHDETAIATEVIAQTTEIVTPATTELPSEPSLGGAPLQDIPTYGFSKPSRTVFAKPTEKQSQQTPPPPKFTPAAAPVASTNDSVTEKKTATESTEPSAMVMPSTGSTESKHLNQDIHTPEITNGLQQLLSEWKIFKGSGLFGMGPGGIDHPLYQNIQNNSMVSILNGTFDGVTPEIQQSINDYINGWRYEQSIIPQHSETFDNFLRRVVRKVLTTAKR